MFNTKKSSDDTNTGHLNTGDGNTGYRNTGHRNTGHGNTGNWNTGYWNTGYRNTGNWNTGYWNTGYRNTGHRNTGHGNTGNWNTGNWNTGDGNTGHLNTTEPETVRMFNKEVNVKRENIVFPYYFYHDITEWIYESDMTDEEKEEYPTYKTTGGYLRSYEYKEAWRIAWDKASDEDRRKTLDLPGWDNEVFKKISGIDVEKELSCHCHCKCDGCHGDHGKCNFCPNCGYKLN